MSESNPPAANRGAKVNAGSGDLLIVPRLVLVADEHPEGADAAWLSALLLAGVA